MDYRASRENVDYCTEFGIVLSKTEKYGKIENITNLLRAYEKNLITDEDTDMFTEYEEYYNNISIVK